MSILEITQLLGNVGEFIGSLVVLATLIYLASQVRQTKRLLETSIALGRGAASREINGLMVQLPGLSELQSKVTLVSGQVPDRQQVFVDALDCTPAEAQILDQFRYIQFRAMETAFATEGRSERTTISIDLVLATDLDRSWWSHARVMFTEAFGHYVDDTIGGNVRSHA